MSARTQRFTYYPMTTLSMVQFLLNNFINKVLEGIQLHFKIDFGAHARFCPPTTRLGTNLKIPNLKLPEP